MSTFGSASLNASDGCPYLKFLWINEQKHLSIIQVIGKSFMYDDRMMSFKNPLNHVLAFPEVIFHFTIHIFSLDWRSSWLIFPSY